MIRLLHAADLHLDSPFSSLDPQQAAHRREEQRDVLRRLVRECDGLGCDVLLLAGDLFDSDFFYRESAELLRSELGRLKARVFIAPGNHDPWSPGSIYARLQWPENVYIFHTRNIETVRISALNLNVCGAAFLEARQSGLMQGFTAPADGTMSVMVLHGDLGNPASPYNPISEAEIAASGLRYLALGHVHRGEQRVIGGTTVGVPGCAMGRGFDETGVKGALLVELSETDCRLTQIPLGGRIYQSLSLPAGDDPLAAIETRLPPDSSRDIYRITLTGSCPKPDLRALQRQLAPRFHSLELVDATLPPAELWQAAGEDSLKGVFLQLLQELYTKSPEEAERRLAAEAAELGLAVMEGREVPELW